MFWLKTFKSIMTMLHSDIPPRQIGWGAALGAIVGLSPALCLHNIVVILLVFLLNVNISAAFLSMAAFSFIGFFTDPLADAVGRVLLLRMDALTSVWTWLYNLPLVPFTRFNNTVVLGSLVIALLLMPVVIVATARLVVLYRARYATRVEQWRVMKLLKLTTPLNFYDKYRS